MLINIDVKDGLMLWKMKFAKVYHEACGGYILKMIIETALLTEEEIIRCEVVTKAGAEFIKTSTGFSTAQVQHLST